MADKVSMTMVKNDTLKRLEEMVKNAKTPESYLNRIVYRQYQNAQVQRWITEGASEGLPWKPLSPVYAAYKKRRYGGGPRRAGGNWPIYPGAGQKMLIATGRLVGSVIGPNDQYPTGVNDHRKIVDSRSIRIFTVVPYAPDVAKERPFMKFSDKTIGEMRQGLKKYIMGTF